MRTKSLATLDPRWRRSIRSKRRARSLAVLVFIGALHGNATWAGEEDRWELQSNFWVSLHETLLHATQEEPLPEPVAMTKPERLAWSDALGFYRSRFAGRSALRDEEMMRIGWELSRSSDKKLSPALPEELGETLRRIAPVYRSRFWPSHDRAARLWIAVAEALLSETADELIAAHERAYGIPFVSRIQVDVTPYAGRYGGYTTEYFGQAHVRISCLDPGQQGFAALEMMFHEPTHAIVGPSFGAIGPEIDEIARRLAVRPPGQLWHAILFYTSGELTRRALASRGVTGYVPASDSLLEGAYRREAEALREHWRAHLDGETSRAAALELVVRETGESLSGSR